MLSFLYAESIAELQITFFLRIFWVCACVLQIQSCALPNSYLCIVFLIQISWIFQYLTDNPKLHPGISPLGSSFPNMPFGVDANLSLVSLYPINFFVSLVKYDICHFLILWSNSTGNFELPYPVCIIFPV